MATNTTPELAIEITSLPYDLAGLDVAANNYPSGALWWKYTAIAGDLLIGGLATSSDWDGAANYLPSIGLFHGDDPGSILEIINWPVAWGRQPFAFPVTPGHTYWIRVEDEDSGSNAGLTLTLHVERAPVAQLGDIGGFMFIPDENPPTYDDSPWPGHALDPDTGDYAGGIPFPPCERGELLPSGIACVQSLATGEFIVWDTNEGAEVVVIPISTIDGESYECPITGSRQTSQFFLVVPDIEDYIPADVWQVEANGTVTGLIAHLPDPGDVSDQVWAAVVSRDCTRLYYCHSHSGAPWRVHDLTTDTDLGVWLAAPGASYGPTKEALALADGTFIVGNEKIAVPETLVLRHVNSDGDVLHTYTFTDVTSSLNLLARLAYAENDSAESFWIRRLGWPDFYQDTYTEIDIATGATLREMASYENNEGTGPDDPGLEDPPLFGAPLSCPFFVVAGAGAVAIGPIAWVNWPRETEDAVVFRAPKHIPARRGLTAERRAAWVARRDAKLRGPRRRPGGR